MSAERDEALLHAYVDGRLDEAARAQVEAWLAEDFEAASRVAAYRTQNAALHALFDGVLAEPLPAPLRGPWERPRRRTAAVMAAFLPALLLGVAMGWWARDLVKPSPPLVELPVRAAAAHAVYAPEVRHPVEVGAAEEAHLEQWLSKRLGTRLAAPSLVPLGFRLVGGRLLPDAAGPAALFMYEDGEGRRLTLYVARNPGGGETAFRFAERAGVGVFYWVDGPFGYALSGELGRERLLAAARLAHAALTEAVP